MARKASEKIRYGAEFGVALRHLFNDPPYQSPKLNGTRCWNTASFAAATGVSDRAVRNWLNGSDLAGNNIDTIVRVLFGTDQKRFHSEISFLRDVLARCEYRRTEKHPLPESRTDLSAVRTYSDPAGNLLALNYSDIDALPVEDAWHFDAIRYGEGAQIVEVSGNALIWLNAGEKLADPHGARRALVAFFPDSQEDIVAVGREKELFFPQRVIISGPKRQNAVVRIFACTDAPYENGSDDRPALRFEAEAFLGQGGLAAFVDRHGQVRKRSAGEIGEGLGCVVALVAIAYVNRRPVYRSPYCLVIRKGIRYPDDVWLSPATGGPVFSSAEPSQGRFLFKSRESKGFSTDMFTAQFNGSLLENLNGDDPTARDDFVDEDGNDLVSWKGKVITFGSMVSGKGFIEKIEREDRDAF